MLDRAKEAWRRQTTSACYELAVLADRADVALIEYGRCYNIGELIADLRFQLYAISRSAPSTAGEWGTYVHTPTEVEAYVSDREFTIATPEGEMRVIPGDYVVRDINGELYPVKPDVFKRSYAPKTGGEKPK